MTFAQYLDVISQCRPCIGKDATQHPQAELITCNNVTSRRRHSGTCYRIVPLTSKGGICRKCYNLKLKIISGDGDDAATSSAGKHDLCDGVDANECSEGGSCEESDNDHDDSNMDCTAQEISEQYFPNCKDTMAELIQSQSKYLRDEVKGKDRRSRRWLRSIISFVLSVWISNSHAYRLLSNIFIFPTERLLQRYKIVSIKSQGLITTSSTGCMKNAKGKIPH